jgi:hypothetical protein
VIARYAFLAAVVDVVQVDLQGTSSSNLLHGTCETGICSLSDPIDDDGEAKRLLGLPPKASEHGCMELDHRGAEPPVQCSLTFAGQISQTGATSYRLAHAHRPRQTTTTSARSPSSERACAADTGPPAELRR